METITKPKVKMDKSHRRIYKLEDGTKVAGVTTILGIINKPQLLNWAAKEERDNLMNLVITHPNIDRTDLYKLVPKEYFFETKRDSAASVGTICHFMCECYLKNEQPELSEFPKDQVSLAENGFIKFIDFWEKSGFTVVHTEHALIEQKMQYGGTLDTVCKDKDGKLVLLDLKTSKAIYPEYWSQVAAYHNLWNVNNQEKIERNIIVRIGKDEVNDLEVQEISSKEGLAPYGLLFVGALMVYNAQKEIGRK